MSYLHPLEPMSTPPAASGGPPTITPDDLASPGRRIGATLLDALIWGVPFIVGCFLAFETDEATGTVQFNYPIWWLAGGYVFGFLYNVVPVAIWGQTPGKHLVRIRVVSAQDLTMPGWWRAIRRWGIYIAVALVPFVGGLLNLVLTLAGLVMLFVRQNRQTPHDLVADTLVVNDGVHRSVPAMG
jgi:uncharacterized RDD family membrane protein YckC